MKNATTGRLLILYLVYRQITAAIGLHSTAGHPQTVRPLVAPMALAAAEKQHGELTEDEAEKVKAYSAATDNVGLFFGEDIFFAIGSIVLIQQILATYGYNLAPLELALWAIPTAICAFLIHVDAAAAVRPQAGEARPMITLHWLYALAGAMFAAFALLSALDRSNTQALRQCRLLGADGAEPARRRRDRRFRQRPAGARPRRARRVRLHRPQPPADDQRRGARRRWSERLGNKLFLPALIIPATALIGTLAYNYTPLGGIGWIEAKRETYVFLGLGVLLALGAIFAWLRPPAIAPLQEGRRLIDAIGWAAVLPQMLASLGVLFAAAGVGDAIGSLTRMVIPEGSIFLTVAVFGLGMAIFTMIMGNAFAAFPVMAAAIGVPLLIQGYGGDPAVVGAIGMLAGFCGTLMTPMAANFNLVPAALLELKDQYGVIRAQVATALPLLAVNILLIYWLAFR